VRPSTLGLIGLVTRVSDGLCAFDASLPLPAAVGRAGAVAELVRFGEDALLSCEFGWSLATLKSKCEVGHLPSPSP
jgi:hypothetical protein